MASNIHIGILALQGGFVEHQAKLKSLSFHRKIVVVLVRSVAELASCDGLIIPGGESTSIGLLAQLSGLLGPLREFVKTKPVWGTCAGAILLAQAVKGAKTGGQELLGGVPITIERNGYGSQAESFEAELTLEGLSHPELPFKGIFIRAPVILSLMQTDEDLPIQILARLPPELLPRSQNPTSEIRSVVALRRGLHLLTTFHPELTTDSRFHDYFVRECVLVSLT